MNKNINPYENYDIEAIVRLVVDRLMLLREKPTSDNPTSDQPPIQFSVAEVSHSKAEAETKSKLTLNERVISTSLLRGRLDQIASIHVTSRAVVTPAVVDELRDRNIALVRETARNARDEAAAPDRKVKLFYCDSNSCQSVATTLSRILDFELLARINLAPDTIQRSFATTDSTHCVLVSDRPHESLWQIHRQQVRASLCRAPHDVSEAVNDFGAAVLILDGRCGLSSDMVDALRNLNA